jgi:hypothetical protein
MQDGRYSCPLAVDLGCGPGHTAIGGFAATRDGDDPAAAPITWALRQVALEA